MELIAGDESEKIWLRSAKHWYYKNNFLIQVCQLERKSTKSSNCINKDVSLHIKNDPYKMADIDFDEISLSSRTYLKVLTISQ